MSARSPSSTSRGLTGRSGGCRCSASSGPRLGITPLGMARGALDEVAKRIEGNVGGMRGGLADDPVSLADFAEADAALAGGSGRVDGRGRPSVGLRRARREGPQAGPGRGDDVDELRLPGGLRRHRDGSSPRRAAAPPTPTARCCAASATCRPPGSTSCSAAAAARCWPRPSPARTPSPRPSSCRRPRLGLPSRRRA